MRSSLRCRAPEIPRGLRALFRRKQLERPHRRGYPRVRNPPYADERVPRLFEPGPQALDGQAFLVPIEPAIRPDHLERRTLAFQS